MSKVNVERAEAAQPLTVHQAELFLGTWYRIAEDDGSTVAYTADLETAKFIANKINLKRGKK